MGTRQITTGTHMKRLFITLSTPMFLSMVTPFCEAEAIVKCANGIDVTYQTSPCGDGTVTSLVLPPVASASGVGVQNELDSTSVVRPIAGPAPPTLVKPGAANAAVQIPVAPTEAGILAKRERLQAGMSDMQVLNHRRRGKPQRITRNRETRAWHEHWLYESGANAGTQLHFVNGRLAEIADPEPYVPPANSLNTAMVSAE